MTAMAHQNPEDTERPEMLAMARGPAKAQVPVRSLLTSEPGRLEMDELEELERVHLEAQEDMLVPLYLSRTSLDPFGRRPFVPPPFCTDYHTCHTCLLAPPRSNCIRRWRGSCCRTR